MEVGRHGFRPDDAQARWQQTVATPTPGLFTSVNRTVEMYDLASPVNAGVRAPGTSQLDRMIGDLGQRDFKPSLHGGQNWTALLLPAMKSGAVILDA
jgi:hypothetical protein